MDGRGLAQGTQKYKLKLDNQVVEGFLPHSLLNIL